MMTESQYDQTKLFNNHPRERSGPRPLYEIASEIRRDWKNIYFGAVPYVDAMSELDKITDMYFADSAKSIVLRFLSNAQTWRGEVAKRVKTELKQMVK
jgi:hypothetical protein